MISSFDPLSAEVRFKTWYYHPGNPNKKILSGALGSSLMPPYPWEPYY
jgi:hypothetical protein